MEKLVHYTVHQAIDDLVRGRLAVSKASEFNDPFEFHFADPSPHSDTDKRESIECFLREKPQLQPGQYLNFSNLEKIIDEAMAETRNEESKKVIDKIHRVLCCSPLPSKPEHDILMWSHYAGKHQGVRLHFNSTFASKWEFFPIDYLDTPLTYRLPEVSPPHIYGFMSKLLKTKFKNSWEHENERRAFIPEPNFFEDLDSSGLPRSYIEIIDEDLERVDLGIRFANDESKIQDLRKKFPHLKIFQTRKCTKSYSCRYEQVG